MCTVVHTVRYCLKTHVAKLDFSKTLFVACANRDTLLVWVYSKPWAKVFFPEEVLEAEKPYDAFISYSHLDGDYVNDVLLPGLENPENPEYKSRLE